MFIAKLSNGMRVPMRNAEDHRRIEAGEHLVVDIYPDGEPDRDALKTEIESLTRDVEALRHSGR
jgi:hypothetical protein